MRPQLLAAVVCLVIVVHTDGVVHLGTNVPAGAAARFSSYLAQGKVNETLTVSIGGNPQLPACDSLIAAHDVSALKPEGFIVKSDPAQNLICCDGAPAAGSNVSASIGAAYCGYRVLEILGAAFLHPLSPAMPATLALPSTGAAAAAAVSEVEAPGLAFRGFHTHTEHPLELLEVLQGSDLDLGNATVNATNATNATANRRVISWEEQLEEGHVASWLEWCTANRLNRAEWVLLETPEWNANGFVNSTLRRSRLATLASMVQPMDSS